jgi:hypothetical protein
MGWKDWTGKEQQALNSIVSLLLSLAGRAEYTASRSYPVRVFVLWCVRHAEAIAIDFVAGFAPDAPGIRWSRALAAVRGGNRPADALNLAASIRALALMVRSLAAKICRMSCLRQGLAFATAGRDSQQRPDGQRNMLHAAVSAPARRDTS